MQPSAPRQIAVHPTQKLAGKVALPASKSSSTRAVLASALAPGQSRIVNLAPSNNVRALVDAARTFGAVFSDSAGTVTVDGVATPKLDRGAVIDPGNSGIVLRLLLGALAVLDEVRFDTSYRASLGSRANIEGLMALERLGVTYAAEGQDGRLPIRLNGSKIHGGTTSISCRKSSQFLSGLLYLAGMLQEPLAIEVEDDVIAKPMVATTLRVLKRAGVEVSVDAAFRRFETTGRDRFKPATHHVGSDPASTAAMLAVAAVVPSDVTLASYEEEELGDGSVLQYLAELGVKIEKTPDGMLVRGGSDLRARDFDGVLAPDAVLPLAALAAFADGTSRFYNIEHLRYKECDRISDFRAELSRAGVATDETRDSLIIHGNPRGVVGGVVVDSHFDHGVIMALSAVALRSREGLRIRDPRHVAQTYPGFFDDLRTLGASVADI
jgi:3-phosphoshikimate 1-carboxyvinyltransferase